MVLVLEAMSLELSTTGSSLIFIDLFILVRRMVFCSRMTSYWPTGRSDWDTTANRGTRSVDDGFHVADAHPYVPVRGPPGSGRDLGVGDKREGRILVPGDRRSMGVDTA